MASDTDNAERARERFLAFKDTGQPEALADVFDLCAHELLLVAHHLAMSGVAAEDLIQTTFLVAMKNAESFDGTRPLMPWLCGILANTARSENRRARQLPDGRRTGVFDVDDPAELAQARELAAETLRKIGDLPARQREVLTLRLVHGLTPTEIAHALHEPLGTVKSWIHRGVERLRATLPAGFAAALVLLVGGTRGLAEAKDAVLAEAARLRPTAAAPVPTSAGFVGLPASSAWFHALVLLAVASVAWWVVRPRSASIETPAPFELPSQVVATAADTVLPTRVPVDGDPSAPTIGTTLRVRARFADGATSPIAFRLTPRFGVEPDFREVEFTTDPRGEVTLADLAPGRYELVPDRAAPRTVDVAPGENVIVVELPSARRIEGRVVDAQGRAVAGAGVWLSSHREISRGAIVARTDDAGRYVVRDVSTARNVGVFADGFACAPLQSIAVAAIAHAADPIIIDFTLSATSAPIESRVVGENGEPLVGALVQLGASADPSQIQVMPHHVIYPTLLLRTDASGSFHARAAPPGPLRVWARAPSTAAHRGVLRDAADDLAAPSIVLARGGSAAGRVLAAGGRAAGAFAESRFLEWGRAPADDVAPGFASPRAFAGPDGAFQLSGLLPGMHALFASGELGATARHDAAVLAGETFAWSPRLEASNAVQGLALDAAGVPLEGYRVAAVDDAGEMSAGVVGADGRFRIDAAKRPILLVSLNGPEGGYPAPLTHRLLPLARDEELVLRLSEQRRPSATLRARAFDAAGAVIDKLRATSAAAGTILRGETSADGWTTFRSLPPGEYFLTVAGDQGVRLLHGPILLAPNEVRDCGDVRVPAAGRVRVRVESSAAALPASSPCTLITRHGGHIATYFVLDHGEGTSPPVPAGRYLACAQSSIGADPVAVEVVPDGLVDAVLRVVPMRDVGIAFHHADLCAGTQLRLHWIRDGADEGLDAWCVPIRITGADDGRAVYLTRLRPGSYRLDVGSCEGLSGTARVDVLDEDVQQAVEIELR